MRTVPEWIGTSDDSPAPPRVKARVYDRQDGKCAMCTRECKRGLRPAYDHIKALINAAPGTSGTPETMNREGNLQLLCVPCHAKKTWADLAEKSNVARKRNKHLGIQTKPKRPIGSRGFARTNPQRTASRPIERRS